MNTQECREQQSPFKGKIETGRKAVFIEKPLEGLGGQST